MERTDTLVIGAGQAGLSTSYHLTRVGREHLVLEAARIGETWRSRRWDSFTLVTPNWTLRLPGLEPPPGGPDAFLDRSVIVDMLEGYAARIAAPVREGVAVERLERDGPAGGFVARTSEGPIAARQVVVATGFYRRSKRPAFATAIATRILQIDATEYRNAQALPEGGVVVVGSGQSGCQVAEDLRLGGREVWLSVGRAIRIPRRYRGRDGMLWWGDLGRWEWTEDKMPDPRGRFAPNPHLSGTRGGHTINLHRFAQDGMHLVGRIREASGERLAIDPDLHDKLAHVDAAAARFVADVDRLIEGSGVDAPSPDPTNTDEHDGREGYEQPLVEQLDLAAMGISTIVWAVGYVPAFDWIHVPVFDADGQPIHEAGVTSEPGLAFVGLRFQRWLKSDLFLGVGEDAGLVVDRLAGIGRAPESRVAGNMPA